VIWLSVLRALLDVAGWISKTLHDRQLLNAGEYKAIARANEEALNTIRAAVDARRAPGVSEDDDPDNRDRR
jgi:hypothetical protein